MKNIIIKLLILIQIIMLIFPTICSIASTVNVGDILYVERGELGFYTIQYWSTYSNAWRYITYSRTYYTDNEGQKRIAYCMDPEADGVGWLPDEYEGYDTEVKYKLQDERIWRILKHGYPNVLPEELGVIADDDAYLATKQAIYWVKREWPLEDIYKKFQVGETQINGQDLEETQYRAGKVIDAIYKLVDIAYNHHDETISEPQIVMISDFKQDENDKYYSREYKVTNSSINTKINFDNIENVPEYAFIADKDGIAKNEFKQGEIFKIMVPKSNIYSNYNIQIHYEQEMEAYPIYYTASKIEGKQNYVILQEKTEKKEGTINATLDAYKSSLKIIKTDSRSNKPIEGVKFHVEYDYGAKIGEFTTDANGEINIENLLQGNIKVQEIATNDDYELDSEIKNIKLNYNEMYILNVKNTHKTGNIEIEKVDKDNNDILLGGVEFDLINSAGEIVNHLITDDNGKAECNNIDTGEYILRETKTKEEYKIGVDKNITINWNETLKIRLENEKKKGKIKVIKFDKEDENIKIPKVRFSILNSNNEEVQNIVTDENGEATSEDLPIGNYYLKETETAEKYILDNSLKEITIQEGEVQNIKIVNERIKGNIKIIKTSEDRNEILNINPGEPIQGVKFGIYNEDDELIEEIVTDKNGVATSIKLEKGKYIIKEIETDKWYILNNNKHIAEIKNKNETVEVNITNQSKNPKVDIEKSCKNILKPNEEIDYKFNIKNVGNTNIENFTWYDLLPVQHAKITKIQTGTYNQELIYDICYKTNQKNEYVILKKALNSKENHYIDLNGIYLNEQEEITEIKICFGNINVGFQNIVEPHIFMKINDNVSDNTEIKNHTLLEGTYQDYKVFDEDIVTSIVRNRIEKKKLPRTGF